MSKGFTLIEILVVILLNWNNDCNKFQDLRKAYRVKTRKKFTYTLWEELEVYAKEQYELTGQQSWRRHPLSVLGRTRNIIVTYDLGI